MNDFKWIVKARMSEKRIPTLLELSKETGIGYQTLRTHINCPERLNVYELNALNGVLEFNDGEIANLIRGMK